MPELPKQHACAAGGGGRTRKAYCSCVGLTKEWDSGIGIKRGGWEGRSETFFFFFLFIYIIV